MTTKTIKSSRRDFLAGGLVLPTAALVSASGLAASGTSTLESKLLKVEIEDATGRWYLLDKRSGARWPSDGLATPGEAPWPQGGFTKATVRQPGLVRLLNGDRAVVFALAEGGLALELRYEDKTGASIRVLGDASTVSDDDHGGLIVPCREGMLIPSDSGKAFKDVFGTCDYEPGTHMNVIGVMKRGSVLMVTWDDAYVFPEIQSVLSQDQLHKQHLSATFELRRTARSLCVMPLGKGDWNSIAASYRRYAESKGKTATLHEKIRRAPHLEMMVGASNVKLWQCLSRRQNEESTKVESQRINWTFDEAAQVAEHMRKDLEIDRCFFVIGGWTEGGYDVRHPDDLPANQECGGNDVLAEAIRRIQALDYVACLHDNVQDMYRDAKSWNPALIEKNPDGALVPGGRWAGGRAWMVCAPKQLELAQRPQNLPAIHKLFGPWGYFIDTTYAVGPRECYDPNHPIGRNEDIAWKKKLSDYARDTFGIFGSECGREWALPHSDYFEGLVGVGGKYFHRLNLEEYGSIPIPFWEMVYHDCQICYGKYGYAADKAAEYVDHHILCARTLNYHSVPQHLYWKSEAARTQKRDAVAPPDIACFTRSDGGWADGMHPYDVFIKNTHEILGHLHSATAHDTLTGFEFLTPDRTLRQATYGRGRNLSKVTVNFGAKEAAVSTMLGGDVVLPQWGFVIATPQFAAFYALRWGSQRYDTGALFTMRALDGKTLSESRRVRVFHAFGPASIDWKNKTREVRREQVIEL